MAMIGKVKRMYFREKKSVREIVRLTSLSRNTVRKWLKAEVLEAPKYRRSEAPGICGHGQQPVACAATEIHVRTGCAGYAPAQVEDAAVDEVRGSLHPLLGSFRAQVKFDVVLASINCHKAK
jgi:hypothetical protein